jgi:hypothetical protein
VEEEKGRQAMGTLLAIVAVIAAVGSVLFAGWQIRISRATAELQVETAVVTRLDDLLFKVADDPAYRRAVWGEHAEEDHPQVAPQAIANLLQVGLTAVHRLPGFQSNKESWDSYTKDMLEHSPGVLEEILNHRTWWPAVTPIADDVKRRQGAQEQSAADGKAPPPETHDS